MGRNTTTSGLDWNTMLGLAERLKKDKRYKDYLLLIIGCHFGLRASDLLSLKWSDIFERDNMSIREKKTDKVRNITINERVKDAVKFCFENQQPELDGFIFCNRWGTPYTISYLNKRIKLIADTYRIKTQNPSSHLLRKTFGKRVYDSDGQTESALVQLSEIFSHSSTSTTRRYIGITEEQIANVYLGL